MGACVRLGRREELRRRGYCRVSGRPGGAQADAATADFFLGPSSQLTEARSGRLRNSLSRTELVTEAAASPGKRGSDSDQTHSRNSVLGPYAEAATSPGQRGADPD